MISIPERELGELADVVRGITFPASAKQRSAGPGLIPCLRTANVQAAVEWDDLIYVDEEYLKKDEQIIKVGDILVSMSNSLNLVGKCALISHAPQRATFGAFIAVLRPKPGIKSEYVLHATRSPSFRAHMRRVASTTTNISNINTAKLRAAIIPLFEREVRDTLADKIDELFSQIDEGEHALARVQKLVERYRQSVLKAAVTGELTPDWREKQASNGQPPGESGEALLRRILKARREAWEKAELERMKGKGKSPKNDDWKTKYSEPTPPETIDLPQLPDGWAWASLDMIADVVGGITVDKKRNTEDCLDVPYLRVANVQRGYLDLNEIKTLKAPIHRVVQLRLEPGDILFNEGGDVDKLGRGWIWEGQMSECIHQNHVFRARLFRPGAWNKLISWYANVLGQRLFMQMGKQTTNLASLSLSKLKRFPVPIMNSNEANEIVSRVEDALSVADKQVKDLAHCDRESDSLRQAVLKAAFSGELLPQNSTTKATNSHTLVSSDVV